MLHSPVVDDLDPVAELGQPVVLVLDVVHGKPGKRYAVFDQGLAVGLKIAADDRR